MKNSSFYTGRSMLQAFVITLGCFVLALTTYVTVEPFFANAATSQSVAVTLDVTSGIAVNVNSNSAHMSTNLGVAQDTAVGTSTFTVETNDGNGYTLNVAAATNPAMKSGSNSISNFPNSSSPELWSSGLPSSGAVFGFSVIGKDASPSSSYWGSGNYCNGSATSTVSSTLKYSGFSTAGTTTAKSTSTTTPAGDSTVICYAVQQNNFYIPAGAYTANITGTAVAN